MESLFTCPVEDLVAATGTRSSDERIVRCLAHLGEETQFSHLHTECVVFGFVAERASHTTAARFQEADHEIGRKAQGLCGEVSSGEGFLMAVAVYDDRLGLLCKLFRTNSAGLGFAHDKLFQQQSVLAQRLCRFTLRVRYEAGVFIPEAEDGRGFQSNEGLFGGNEW